MTIKYLDAKRIRGSSTADALKSARFDGVNDNAISADALGISLGNNYSFGGWANPEAQSSSIGMALYMAGTLYLYRTSGVWKTEGNGISITGSIDVGVDSWKHVMVNVVNGTATLYVDGVADGTDANTTSSTTITRIQMGEEGTSYEYKGNLSDWFFYSRALTTAEIASLSGGAQVSSISQTNLEANYTFDSNLNDRSSNSRHLATVTGDVTGGNTKGTSPTGIDEKATLVDPYGTAEFDGSGDYARVNNSVLNNVTDDWTIAMWYKTDDLTTGDAVIGCYTTGGTAGWQIYQKENNLIISDGTNHARNNLTFTTGTWYHIAWVCTSGTLQMFVDGVVSNIALATGGGSYGSYAASQSYGHELDSPDNTLNFGQRGDNDKYFDGRLQDAGFWTRALSSADIVLLAAGTPIDKAALATTYTTGLQGYFKFNGNFNSEVNSYTGTASGNATTSTSGGEFNNASNLPENTLFEETDTRKIYGLESGAWNVWYGNPKIWASGNCTRGIIAGGSSPSSVNTIDYITIDTSSASSEFGDLLLAVNALTGVDNGTRAVFGGVTSLDMSYVTIATAGNALDFGDLNVAQNDPPIAGMRNHTRGIFAGGQCSGSSQTGKGIEFITIDTKGNGTTFGELTVSVNRCAGVSSEAGRGLRIGGSDCDGLIDSIDYITIATAGDATDYGDLGANLYYLSAASDGSRWVTLGGEDGNATNICKYGEIATEATGTTFGNLTQSVYQACGISGTTRGVRIGGNTGSTHTDTMDYVVIQTVAGATDFGDLRTATKKAAGASGA